MSFNLEFVYYKTRHMICIGPPTHVSMKIEYITHHFPKKKIHVLPGLYERGVETVAGESLRNVRESTEGRDIVDL